MGITGRDMKLRVMKGSIFRLTPRAKAAVKSKPNLLIDIQAKMQQANSPGFERWAKTFNLKEMAKTVIYLQENGLTD